MKTLSKISVIVPVLALALAPAENAFAISADNQTPVANGAAYLQTQQAADGHIGASASETGWSAVALSAAGFDLSTVHTSGGTSLRAHLAANAPGAAAAATDWERSIIAITADGQNPYNFGGTDYVAHLKTFAASGQIGSATAVNDDLFGLIALSAARDSLSDTVLTDALAFVLAAQHADGGFSYTTDPATGSDTNDTAAAIMALKALQNAGLASTAVTTALTNATSYLLGTQNADGGFPYDPLTPPAWGGPVSDVSSTSWVVMAFDALGQANAPAGTNAQAYIRAAQSADGSFPYQAPAAGDVFDTTPAVTALAGGQFPLSVYAGLLPGQGDDINLQSRSPSPSPSPSPSVTPTPSPTPAGSVLGASTTPPASATGTVLGSSTLPAVGVVSNLILLLMAAVIAALTGLAVRLHFARARNR